MFSENVGTRDRDIRIVLIGLLAILSFFLLHGFWTILAGGVALILLATVITGFCPIYRILGISTRNMHDDASSEITAH